MREDRTDTNKRKFLEIAKKAALTSGKIQMDYLEKTHNIRFKGTIDLVTEVDLLCEKTIIALLKKNFPDHDILAEESGGQSASSPWKWIIDPLDGTTNYAHGFPFFCTSIALEYQKEIIVGVVFDPIKNELFHALRGKGAFLNGKQIHVSTTDNLQQSVLATGFPYDIKNSIDTTLRHLRHFLLSAQAIRRAGSAALDLCYTACGRLDGYWEAKLSPWDMAAGILIVQESGGIVTDFCGHKHDSYTPALLANNTTIHKQMLDIIKSNQ